MKSTASTTTKATTSTISAWTTLIMVPLLAVVVASVLWGHPQPSKASTENGSVSRIHRRRRHLQHLVQWTAVQWLPASWSWRQDWLEQAWTYWEEEQQQKLSSPHTVVDKSSLPKQTRLSIATLAVQDFCRRSSGGTARRVAFSAILRICLSLVRSTECVAAEMLSGPYMCASARAMAATCAASTAS